MDTTQHCNIYGVHCNTTSVGESIPLIHQNHKKGAQTTGLNTDDSYYGWVIAIDTTIIWKGYGECEHPGSIKIPIQTLSIPQGNNMGGKHQTSCRQSHLNTEDAMGTKETHDDPGRVYKC
eukprot:12706220-Ditylum_brightwellii.AAC.1